MATKKTTKKTTKQQTKQYCCVSHVERLNNPALQLSPTARCIPYTSLSSVEEVNSQGRIVRTSKEVIASNKDNFRHFRVADFSIENLSASGALDKMNRVQFKQSSSQVVSNLESQLSNIEQSFNNN